MSICKRRWRKGAWMMDSGGRSGGAASFPVGNWLTWNAPTVQLPRLYITLVFLLKLLSCSVSLFVSNLSLFFLTDSFSSVSVLIRELLWLARLLLIDGRAEATCWSHDCHHYLCKTCHPTSACCFVFSNEELLLLLHRKKKERSTRYPFLLDCLFSL